MSSNDHNIVSYLPTLKLSLTVEAKNSYEMSGFKFTSSKCCLSYKDCYSPILFILQIDFYFYQIILKTYSFMKYTYQWVKNCKYRSGGPI